MKTMRRFWKVAVLVLALLFLGAIPTAAQGPDTHNPELYIPYVGGSPGVGEAAAKKPVEDDKLERKEDRFVALLQSDGFEVREGKLLLAPISVECCKTEPPLPCTYFNRASPYQAAYLPLSPGQTSVEPPYLRYPDYPELAAAWRLRPDEAVVFVGLTPPPVRYFGFQTYLFWTVDEAGNRVRKWNNFGDQTNQLVISTAGTPNGTPGNPFNSLTIRITTADRGIDARVREAARRAGYSPSIMNTEPIPQSLLRMGIDEDGDIFSYLLRAAMPLGDPEDLAAYKAGPNVRIFRITPKTDAPVYPETSPDPFPIPGFRAHGTGQTEFELLPAVRDLRKAILSEYDEQYAAEEFTSYQWIFYGLHHMDLNDDGLAPSTDALYLRTQSFGTLEPDEFVIAYGANHHLTGKAMYMNVTMYGTTKQIAADDVDDTQLEDSAAGFLPGDLDVDMLYAYKFARHCDDDEEFCFEVPYGCCGQQNNPDSCFGDPGCAGMQPNEEGIVVWRAYLDPVSKTGPDPMEVLFDRAIKFSPKD